MAYNEVVKKNDKYFIMNYPPVNLVESINEIMESIFNIFKNRLPVDFEYARCFSDIEIREIFSKNKNAFSDLQTKFPKIVLIHKIEKLDDTDFYEPGFQAFDNLIFDGKRNYARCIYEDPRKYSINYHFQMIRIGFELNFLLENENDRLVMMNSLASTYKFGISYYLNNIWSSFYIPNRIINIFKLSHTDKHKMSVDKSLFEFSKQKIYSQTINNIAVYYLHSKIPLVTILLEDLPDLERPNEKGQLFYRYPIKIIGKCNFIIPKNYFVGIDEFYYSNEISEYIESKYDLSKIRKKVISTLKLTKDDNEISEKLASNEILSIANELKLNLDDFLATKVKYVENKDYLLRKKPSPSSEVYYKFENKIKEKLEEKYPNYTENQIFNILDTKNYIDLAKELKIDIKEYYPLYKEDDEDIEKVIPPKDEKDDKFLEPTIPYTETLIEKGENLYIVSKKFTFNLKDYIKSLDSSKDPNNKNYISINRLIKIIENFNFDNVNNAIKFQLYEGKHLLSINIHYTIDNNYMIKFVNFDTNKKFALNITINNYNFNKLYFKI